ncbi:MAG: hypothetical protein LBF63_03410 [Treponema sp.]|jgi:hypothetical protein|nr:hypothetical protein [Treponema sp.]
MKMSDESTLKKADIVKPYLGFLDANVLFKKPVSCLLAILSLLSPVFILNLLVISGVFESKDGGLIAAGILCVVVFLFSGIFGALIWWHRRIHKDNGPRWYDNFRCFIQTLGEYTGTVFAINVFFSIIISLIILGEKIAYIAAILPFPVPRPDFSYALAGPIVGFLIILATKIFLFLLDPIIWLIRQIWGLVKRIVLYYYRCVVKLHGVIEQNAPVWIGFVWLVSLATVISGIALLFKNIIAGGALSLTLGLVLMGFLVIKRKQYDQ